MAAQVYLLVALAVLAVGVRAGVSRGAGADAAGRLTRLAGVAFALVVAGVLFGEHQPLGYALMGAGVALAVVDIVRRSHRHAA